MTSTVELPAVSAPSPRTHPAGAAAPAVGHELHALATRLFPLCRSLTGRGVRETLRILQEYAPFAVHEIPSGTRVFDWTIPDEWTIRDAWIKGPDGRKVVDFRVSNLHVLQYSPPVSCRLSLAELRPHLFTIPEHPSWVPYRTAFYRPVWGFCLAHDQLRALPEGEYEVCIDSTLAPGSLTYGEFVVPGREAREILVHSHVCHPSLANDNLSGLALVALLARETAARKPRFTHRFVLTPGSIGAIAWLAQNASKTRAIEHGLVLACLGGPGPIHYKKSRRGDAVVDRAAALVLRESGHPHVVRDFSPYGYGERQFCSPGFDLPVGCLMRTPHGEFPEYHTSADNLDYITPALLADSYENVSRLLRTLDDNRTFLNLSPYGEPRLGDRGLYGAIGGDLGRKDWEMALLWLLNLSDGRHNLVDIATRAGLRFDLAVRAAAALETAGLLKAGESAP